MPCEVIYLTTLGEIMSLGENLRRLRRDKGLNQNELSTLSDVKAGHISKIENNNSDPKLSTLLKLINALECSPNALLQGSEDMNLSAMMRATFERANALDDESKEVIINLIDHYCIAKGMEKFMSDRGSFLGNVLAGTAGDIKPVIKKKQSS